MADPKKTICPACGGEGWLPSRPEGASNCPYCKGTGKVLKADLPRIAEERRG